MKCLKNNIFCCCCCHHWTFENKFLNLCGHVWQKLDKTYPRCIYQGERYNISRSCLAFFYITARWLYLRWLIIYIKSVEKLYFGKIFREGIALKVKIYSKLQKAFSVIKSHVDIIHISMSYTFLSARWNRLFSCKIFNNSIHQGCTTETCKLYTEYTE